MNEFKTAGILLVVALVTGGVFLAVMPKSAEPISATAPGYRELRGRAFGTSYHLQWEELVPGTVNMKTEVDTVFARLDETISSYRPDSEVARFNTQESTIPFRLSPDVSELFEVAFNLERESGGTFSPTVAPLLKAWGLGPYPRRDKIPDAAEIAAAQKRLGTVKLEAGALTKSDPQASVDLSGMGEGVALKRLAILMEECRFKNYYIELGGEVFARGVSQKGRAWRVGIERPEANATELWCVVEIDGVGLSTSGNYRNFFEFEGKQYSHILDPRGGRPVEHNLVSVSVIDVSPLQSDGWDTALMVLGVDAGYAKAVEKNLAALFIYKENGALKSRQTPAFEKYVVKDARP